VLSNELKGPWSVTFHASWVVNDSYRRSVFTHLKSVSFVRVISKEVEKCLINYIGPVLSKKINVLHIGVNCENSSIQDEIRDSEAIFTIASAGWLLPHKGFDVSMLAARKLLDKGVPNFKWFFYGDGPLLKTLSTLVIDLKLENNVVLAGAIDNKKLLNLYKNRKIDLFIMNSVKRNGIQEGIPVSIMEAMSYSVPVIASNCGGTIELVDGKSGILLSENDSEGTANAIFDLMNNYNECLTQGDEGRKKVFNEFNTHKIAKQLMQLFFENNK
jgi:colanic acid/amylovoran biosynthesis glycosyltransferase